MSKNINKTLEGIFCVNKPKFMTSMHCVMKLKSIIKKETGKKVKAGHGGTLDPLATGVLVVAVGSEYCKSLSKYLKGQKRYLATGQFGSATDTLDRLGLKVNEAPFDHITFEKISETLPLFTGRIEQVSPIYSAKKFKGKRMYDLARQGIEVKPKRCIVHVHEINCLEYNGGVFKIEVECGGGTYIRSLIHDIGKQLNTYAHMIELERTIVYPFKLEHAISEEDWSIESIRNGIERCKEPLHSLNN